MTSKEKVMKKQFIIYFKTILWTLLAFIILQFIQIGIEIITGHNLKFISGWICASIYWNVLSYYKN
jgi:hypothetical protein